MTYDLRDGKYPYPLNELASDGGDVSDLFVDGDPTIVGGSTNWYVLCLTPQQLSDLQSIIAIGAPIGFPDSYNDIIQKYSQMREFPNQVPDGSCMDFCDLTLDCINDTPAIQEAIGQYSTVSAIDQTSSLDITAGLLELVNNPPSCDNDIIFGMTTQLIELMNIIATDIFEIISAGASPVGRIGDIIEAIPGVGILPIDDMFQFVETFLNDLEALYASKYTVILANKIRCDLLCIAEDDCKLTLNQVRAYYYSKISVTLDTTSWVTTVVDFINGVWGGDDIVYITHYMILDVFERLGSIFGFTAENITPLIQAMFNDPDSDWTTVCSTCGWTYFSFFINVDDGWIPYAEPAPYDDPQATYAQLTGWTEVDLEIGLNQFARMCAIFRDIADTDINDVTITYDMTKGSFTTPSQASIAVIASLVAGGTSVGIISFTDVVNGDGQQFTYTVDDECDNIRVLARCSRLGATPPLSGSCKVVDVKITGTGTNPYP